MRNGCLPNLGNTYLWKRKSKSKTEEKTAAKTKEVPTLMIEKCWIREDAECKSHVHDSSPSVKKGSLCREEVTNGKPRDKLVYKSIVHDSSAANKNSILRESEVITAEAKKMADEKLDDFIALDESLDTEKDEGERDKLTIERRLKKLDVNRTKAEQDSTQDQAKQRRGYAYGRPVLPKFGEWDSASSSDDGFTVTFNKARGERRGGLNDEFHKVKTFDLRGVKSSGKGRKSITWSRLF